jgi:hypothetical protein
VGAGSACLARPVPMLQVYFKESQYLAFERHFASPWPRCAASSPVRLYFYVEDLAELQLWAAAQTASMRGPPSPFSV